MSELAVSSLEIAASLMVVHTSVKRSIERLAERGVIEPPAMHDVNNRFGKSVSVYKLCKRDVAKVCAQFASSLQCETDEELMRSHESTLQADKIFTKNRTPEDWLPLATAVTSFDQGEIARLRSLKKISNVKSGWVALSQVVKYLPVPAYTINQKWRYRAPQWLRVKRVGKVVYANTQDLQFYMGRRSLLTEISKAIDPDSPPVLASGGNFPDRVPASYLLRGTACTTADIAKVLGIKADYVRHYRQSFLPKPLKLNASAKRLSSYYPLEVLDFVKSVAKSLEESPCSRAMCIEAARKVEATYAHIYVDELVAQKREQLQKSCHSPLGLV